MLMSAICAATLAGCGSASTPAQLVRLSITRPVEGASTLGAQVLVSGTVAAPAPATVLVGGRQATVSGDAFSARVAVQPGSNLIDVLAGAPGARAAMSAVRVYRELPVAIPDVDGLSPSEASAELGRLGLGVQVYDVSTFFQSVLPLSKRVCTSIPLAGHSVAPGSSVAIQVAKVC